MQQIWLFLLLMTATANAQTTEKVIFRVMEKGTGRPIPRVEVVTEKGKLFTDRQGNIEVELSQQTPLEFYRPGYQKAKVTPEQWLTANPYNLFLLPTAPTDNEVLVRGVKRPEVSRKKLEIEEAKAVAPRGDPAQVTKLLPGVQSGLFSPQITVRGSEPDDTLYYIDGIQVPFVYHGIGGISVVPEKLLDAVEFSAGGFGSQYGDATGGVVTLGSKPQIPEEPYTQAKINIPFFAGIYHERPLSENEAISASIRQSYLGYFVETLMEDSGVVIVPVFYDSHLRYIKTDGGTTTKVLALSSLDGLKAVLPSGGDESGNLKFDVRTYFGALGLEHSQSIGGGWAYSIVPQVVFSKVTTEVIDSFVRIRGPQYRFPLEFSKRIEGSEKLFVGIEAEYSDVDVDILAPRVNPDDPFVDFEEAPIVESSTNVQEQQYAFWSSVDWRIGSVVLTPGIRAFHATQVNRSGWDPRLSGRWELSKQVRAKAAVGLYTRKPQPQESDENFGNPDLSFERSVHQIIGWERDWGQKWTMELQFYDKRWFDVVRSDPVLRFNNDGERKSRGFELFLRRNRTEKMFGWISYTYSKTEERENTAGIWGPSEVDQTHVLNVVGNYALSGQWSLGGRLNYHSGDRYTPVSDAVYNADYAKYQPRYQDNARFAERLPDYYQFDIYNVYDFLYDYWKLKLRTGIEYLSFSRPAFGVDYNYDYTEETFLTGLPPIPYIELSAEF